MCITVKNSSVCKRLLVIVNNSSILVHLLYIHLVLLQYVCLLSLKQRIIGRIIAVYWENWNVK